MTKKIISCNPSLINSLMQEDKIPERFLSTDYKELYKTYTEKFPSNKFYFDRTGTIPHYLNVEPDKFSMPTVENFNMTFDEVAEKRAKEFLSTGKTISVSWSGGLDSTFVLMTLYHYAEDKSQIKVYGTYNSILEAGPFFERYINGTIPFDIHVNVPAKDNYPIRENEIYVTGSMGNDLFQPGTKRTDRDSWMLFKDTSLDFKDLLDKPYQEVLQDPNLEFLEDFIKKSPKKIETLQDLRWWTSFSFNWYNCITNSYIGLEADKSKTIHPFFGSDDFQRWTMTNSDPSTKIGDYTDERWQLREKITEYTGSDLYSKNKKKATSVLSRFPNDWAFMLEDYSNVYTQDL